MNAKQARILTNEALDRIKKEIDISKILEAIKIAAGKGFSQVKLLKTTTSRDRLPECHINDWQVAKLKELYYNVREEAHYDDDETFLYIVLEW